MKKFILLFLCLVLFLTGCVSSKHTERSYAVFPEVGKIYKMSIGSIVVTKDGVKDSDLAFQVRKIAETLLLNVIDESRSDEVLSLQIDLKQRSYYKGLKQENSIYLVYSLLDMDKKILFNRSYSLISPNSIDSIKVENVLLERMSKNIKKYFKKCAKYAM